MAESAATMGPEVAALPAGGRSGAVLAGHRFHQLDGLRGIAALMVGVNHSLGAVVNLAAYAASGTVAMVTANIISGAVAVDLFFVMSGFFLCMMLEGVAPRRVGRFYLRRLARLVPPAVLSVLIIYAYASWALTQPPAYADAAPYYRQFYAGNHAMTARDLLLNILLIRHSLNPVLWTIRIEIVASLLFPLLFWVKNLRGGFWYRTALLLVLVLTAVAMRDHQQFGLDTLHYLYIFYAGALVRDFGQVVRDLRRPAAGVLAVAAVAGLIAIGAFVSADGGHPLPFDILVTGCGAVLVAVLAYGGIGAVRALLENAAVQFLGRLSYSFYLIDWLAVRTAGSAVLYLGIAPRYGLGAALAVITVVSTAAGLCMASVLHVAVEQPAVALSRYLGRRAA